jgi:hypothetical protein
MEMGWWLPLGGDWHLLILSHLGCWTIRACSNIIENMDGTIRRVCANVNHWRDADMNLCWSGAAMQAAVKGFRRRISCHSSSSSSTLIGRGTRRDRPRADHGRAPVAPATPGRSCRAACRCCPWPARHVCRRGSGSSACHDTCNADPPFDAASAGTAGMSWARHRRQAPNRSCTIVRGHRAKCREHDRPWQTSLDCMVCCRTARDR